MLYLFENFSLSSECRELRCNGVLRSIEPQVFDLLHFLIEHRNQVVSREAILKSVWHGRIVSESVLNTRINAVRQALDDDGRQQRLIRTAHRRGFMFVGSLQTIEGATAINTPSRSRQFANIVHNRPKIAVLPFSNVGNDSGSAHVADGLTEELIVALSKVTWLSVTSRNTSFAEKGGTDATSKVARKLGVRYVLEGSVRYSDGRIRVTAHLIDGLVDHQLWTERYDRKISDLMNLQNEIADEVTAAVEPQLFFAEDMRMRVQTIEDLDSWGCMVRALALMNSRERRNIAAARKFLQQAVGFDPNSAQAYSLLSMVSTLSLHMSWTRRRNILPFALEMARKALALSAEEPWAHAALGYASIWLQPAEALPHLHRAISLNPNFAIGHYMIALASTYAGDSEPAFEHAEKAERLARRDLLARGFAGAHHNVRSTASFASGRHDQGIEFARAAIAASPLSPAAHRALIINLALGNQIEKARAVLPTLKHVAPDICLEYLGEIATWSRDADAIKYTEAFRLAGLE